MSPEVTAAIIAAGASVLTLIGTVIAQIIGFRSTHKDTADTLRQQREQMDKTLAEQREQLNKTLKAQSDQLDRSLAEQRTRTLNERFTTAAEQLGSDKPAVRLAGVYAMAGLADDWQESRQACVDVLCGQLRMPYEPDPGQDAPEPRRLAFQAIREVRHTVIRVITAHIKNGAVMSWQALNFDFTGVVFDGGDFRDANFSGGRVDFVGAEFSGGVIDFSGARFSSGEVDFSEARFSNGEIHFGEAEFSGGEVDLRRAHFSGGKVYFVGAEFSGSRVTFSGARFSGGEVYFIDTRFSGGKVYFIDTRFSGGEVVFDVARFSGGEVDFSEAQFVGSKVDFSNVDDWSFPPAFPWAGSLPSGVKIPKKNQS